MQNIRSLDRKKYNFLGEYDEKHAIKSSLDSKPLQYLHLNFSFFIFWDGVNILTCLIYILEDTAVAAHGIMKCTAVSKLVMISPLGFESSSSSNASVGV